MSGKRLINLLLGLWSYSNQSIEIDCFKNSLKVFYLYSVKANSVPVVVIQIFQDCNRKPVLSESH